MSVTTSNGPPVNQTEPETNLANRLLARFRGPVDALPTETLEFFSPSQAVIARPPIPMANRVVAIISTLALSIIVIFGVVRIDRIVQGAGKIVSITPETVVQPLNIGVVKTIAVAQGDIVRKGQLLAQMDPTGAAADNTAAMESVDRYKTEIERLTAELHQTPYHPHTLSAGALIQEGIYAQRAAAREAELRYYQGQIEAQRALVSQANANIRQYAKETGVAVDLEKIRAKLEADAVGSHIDTLNAINQRLESEREVLISIDQARNSQATISALQGELDNFNQQWFADVSETVTQDSVQLASYQDQLEHAALNYKLVDLRAVEDSVVLSIAPVSVGSVLQPGQTFFTLVPINAPLEVDAQVTGNESGFVQVGQPANIKFETFPFLHFGEASGTVRSISADSFLTSAGGGAGTSATGSSSGSTGNGVFTGQNPTSPYFYDVRVSVDRMNMKNVPEGFHITPGMSVSAEIKVGDRTIWEYFTERMLPVAFEGMREPT